MRKRQMPLDKYAFIRYLCLNIDLLALENECFIRYISLHVKNEVIMPRQLNLSSQNPLAKAGFNVLKPYRFRKLFMKVVALSLALSVLNTQIVWALDVRQMIMDAKSSFEE